ncbi:MAG: hypothetical protein KY466_10000 [Gemmatimonadetes bacterium]|nr:hypothetical protein [Gemmatimonadota bacterium]
MAIMHVSLTDVLTCPRCGPGHGLILLPEAVRDRRVVSGFLGCADCRERYPVREGVADLSGGGDVGTGGGAWGGEGGEAVRLAGLLGLGEAQGVVLLAGPAAAAGRELSGLLEAVEVVVAGTSAEAGVSVLRVGGALPFQSAKLRGVALTGPAADLLLEEGARVLAPLARLLLDPAPADARERLAAEGLRVVAEEGGAVLASR